MRRPGIARTTPYHRCRCRRNPLRKPSVPARPWLVSRACDSCRPAGTAPDAAAQKLADHRRKLPKCLQCSNVQLAVVAFEVVAQIGRDPHGQRRRHPHLEFHIPDHRRADHDVDVTVERDVARADEGVVEALDRRGPRCGREPTGSSTRPFDVNRPTQPSRSCTPAAAGDRSAVASMSARVKAITGAYHLASCQSTTSPPAGTL